MRYDHEAIKKYYAEGRKSGRGHWHVKVLPDIHLSSDPEEIERLRNVIIEAGTFHPMGDMFNGSEKEYVPRDTGFVI